ncbi:hypothetical protein H6G74_17810 [Nostoc spongiaeforme FACHB-130]|uniref:Uncharacterized protein n=1 Tax=Nostoc spongiaeforme FACHB-130 TaxID=1357510 RepID=A0ABR8FXK2_9NOSO|nr:kelch repeat-containing protein [Nostoc spongiaeforme]MBD2596167.1 hypothetical protein [Nostoc spongiaeforme FACHB-130]
MQAAIPKFIWKKPNVQGIYPQPRYGHSAILYQASMIIFGGEDNNTYEAFNDVHLLDLTSWTWIQPQISGQIPEPRSFHTTVLYQDKMLVWGGHQAAQDGGYIFSDVAIHSLDLKTWEWSEITPDGIPPDPRSHHSAVLFQDKLLIDGGSYDIYSARDDLHILDITKMCWLNIQINNCRSSSLAGLKVRDQTLVKFLGDAAYGGFCQDILTLELGNLDNINTWQLANFKGIDNYRYSVDLQDNDEEEIEDEFDDEENVIPCRTIHGYSEFGNNIVLFAGMAPGDGVSHMTIGDLIILNMPDANNNNSHNYQALVPEVVGKFPPPRFGHSTIQFNQQMIVYGGLWIDTWAGNNSYDNEVYILEMI